MSTGQSGGKTKNYTRARKNKHETLWKHDSLPIEVLVSPWGQEHGDWVAEARVTEPDGSITTRVESEKVDIATSPKELPSSESREHVRKRAVDWMRNNPRGGSLDPMDSMAEVHDFPQQVDGWTLDDTDDVMVSYADAVQADGEEYIVYIDVRKVDFESGKTIYSIGGDVRGATNTDFRPSSKTQYGDPKEARDAAIKMMESMSAREYLIDVSDRLGLDVERGN